MWHCLQFMLLVLVTTTTAQNDPLDPWEGDGFFNFALVVCLFVQNRKVPMGDLPLYQRT